jgi:phospholipid/cholesterol/gamma-HCH transport system permease protein
MTNNATTNWGISTRATQQLDNNNDRRFKIKPEENGFLTIVLAGDWHLKDRLPGPEVLETELEAAPSVKGIGFDSRLLDGWDTSLLIFVARIEKLCASREMELDLSGLPRGVHRLLELARAVPAVNESGRHREQETLLGEIGETTLRLARGLPVNLEFIGEVVLSFFRLLRNRAQFRTRDLLLIIQQVGPNALPIVSLVSFLVGLILAYMGAAQLERVGVEIYIADLVSIAMVREVGALMTGIIMAGRTGASFAAELGTMQVNEEIDAFKTLGISTMDFLVLPRIMALLLMIPLLTLYSGLVGTAAGMFIGVTVFDITLFEYYQQTLRALELKQFGVGIFKGAVYGVVIAISGCLRGMQCGRSAQAVGEATTSAVVTGIVFIVITASAMTVALYKLGI